MNGINGLVWIQVEIIGGALQSIYSTCVFQEDDAEVGYRQVDRSGELYNLVSHMERDSCGSCSTLFVSHSDTIVVGRLWEFHTILQYVDPLCCWPIAYRQADWMACHEEQEWKWKVRKFNALSSKVPPGVVFETATAMRSFVSLGFVLFYCENVTGRIDFEIWINGDKCINTATIKDTQLGVMSLWVTAFWITLRDRFAVNFMILWDFQVQSHSLIPKWLKYRGWNVLNGIVLLVQFSSTFIYLPLSLLSVPSNSGGVL